MNRLAFRAIIASLMLVAATLGDGWLMHGLFEHRHLIAEMPKSHRSGEEETSREVCVAMAATHIIRIRPSRSEVRPRLFGVDVPSTVPSTVPQNRASLAIAASLAVGLRSVILLI